MSFDSIDIDFEPVGKRVRVAKGTTILEAARQAGIEIISVCGGMGTCGQCRVRVMSGEYTPPTSDEVLELTPGELSSQYRLACQTGVLSASKVHIPPESLTTPQRLQLEGLEGSQAVDHALKLVDIDVDIPQIDDLRSDASRLQDALTQAGYPNVVIRYPTLLSFSTRARMMKWKLRSALRNNELLAVLSQEQQAYGLAVDIGTTKVAAYLLNLVTGEIVSRQSAMNPQIHYGEDVISRIFYCMEHPDGRELLQKEIVSTLNNLVQAMIKEADCNHFQVLDAVVVGNTAMHHLFAGLPVQQLGLMPFVPAISQPVDVLARDLGLGIAPAANIHLPANVAGYVGADHVAMLLATEVYKAEKSTLAVDIGTNTEISLVHDGQIYACSCASGPAFEGAHIKEGMRAAAGAIEKVRIDGKGVHTYTIGNQLPVGICGSGILDAVAEMVKSGILNHKGTMDSSSKYVHGSGKQTEFVLVPAAKTGTGRDLCINRRDVNEILLAKAAIRTGMDILMIEAGIDASQIDRVVVAGAFGTYLDLNSAIEIGMFPRIPLERFIQVGNAAGTGARQMLLSDQMRRTAGEFAGRIRYVELTVHPSFKTVFLKSMALR